MGRWTAGNGERRVRTVLHEMKTERQKREYWLAFLWFMVGMVAGTLTTLYPPADSGERCAALDREYTAYRHCLQTAGARNCRMTPSDFVRYYEVKYDLEHCHGPQTD